MRLGAGSMAAYARPGERWTFYDIDPSVLRIAQDTTSITLLVVVFWEPWAPKIVLRSLQVSNSPTSAEACGA